MRIPDIAAQAGRVYPPPCTTDDLSVPEIFLEVAVVREKQSRTTHARKCENMFVVGTVEPLGSNRLGLRVHDLIWNVSGTTCQQSFGEYSLEIRDSVELPQVSASRNEGSSIPPHQPIVEVLASIRLASCRKDFVIDVRIYDRAHLQADGPR